MVLIITYMLCSYIWMHLSSMVILASGTLGETNCLNVVFNYLLRKSDNTLNHEFLKLIFVPLHILGIGAWTDGCTMPKYSSVWKRIFTKSIAAYVIHNFRLCVIIGTFIFATKKLLYLYIYTLFLTIDFDLFGDQIFRPTWKCKGC